MAENTKGSQESNVVAEVEGTEEDLPLLGGHRSAAAGANAHDSDDSSCTNATHTATQKCIKRPQNKHNKSNKHSNASLTDASSSSTTTSLTPSPTTPTATSRVKVAIAGAVSSNASSANAFIWQKPLQLRSAAAGSKTAKYFTWTCRLLRRRHMLALLIGGVFLLYMNSLRVGEDTDVRIPVQHYSHVPGMKGLATEANETHHDAALRSNEQQSSKDINQRDAQSPSLPPSPTSLAASLYIVSTQLAPNNAPLPAAAPTAVANAVGDAPLLLRHASDTTPAPAASFASAVSLTDDLHKRANQTQTQTVTQSETDLPVSPSLIHSSNLSSYISHNAAAATAATSYFLTTNVSNNFSTFTTVPGETTRVELSTPPPGYLVWSEHCKMPNTDPYSADVMQHFKREPYKPCSTKKPLTSIEFVEKLGRYNLRIELSRLKSYSNKKNLVCSYQSIIRNGTGTNADKEFSLGESVQFYPKIMLPSDTESVLVKCHANKAQVYINGHALVPVRNTINKRLKQWEQKDEKAKRGKPPNILLIGIDSISRVNLIRAMPKTAQYLYDNEWFEMSGYNKVADNTYPNIMALLTGRDIYSNKKLCSPYVLGGLDNCDLIWNTFRDHGYVTAYAEDETKLNTFNYVKVGFEKPPVDYYLRPFLLAAEKYLQIQKKSKLTYCLGYQHTAEFVYNFAIEIAMRYKEHPYFGLFWANTFSHNDISDCASMDIKMLEYLQLFAKLGIFEQSIVVFFSDHGIRFGPTRLTVSGHLEERLPFLFISLPQHMKQQHPAFVNALSVNKNRLTNPYDLHMTLKHLLALSGRVKDSKLLAPAEDCPRCQTLLQPVPHNRSCKEIAIEEHWCTCIPYQSIYRDTALVRKLAQSSVVYINDLVANFRNGSFAKLCRKLQLDRVDSAFRALPLSSGSATVDVYRILFLTKPNKALFEVTLRYDTISDDMEVTGQISRLNIYRDDSACVEDSAAKKYCSCV